MFVLQCFLFPWFLKKSLFYIKNHQFSCRPNNYAHKSDEGSRNSLKNGNFACYKVPIRMRCGKSMRLGH